METALHNLTRGFRLLVIPHLGHRPTQVGGLFYWPTGRATPAGNVRISRGSQKEGDLRPLALDLAHLLSESMRDPVPSGKPSRGKRAPLTLDKPGQRRRHRIDGGMTGYAIR